MRYSNTPAPLSPPFPCIGSFIPHPVYACFLANTFLKFLISIWKEEGVLLFDWRDVGVERFHSWLGDVFCAETWVIEASCFPHHVARGGKQGSAELFLLPIFLFHGACRVTRASQIFSLQLGWSAPNKGCCCPGGGWVFKKFVAVIDVCDEICFVNFARKLWALSCPNAVRFSRPWLNWAGHDPTVVLFPDGFHKPWFQRNTQQLLQNCCKVNNFIENGLCCEPPRCRPRWREIYVVPCQMPCVSLDYVYEDGRFFLVTPILWQSRPHFSLKSYTWVELKAF